MYAIRFQNTREPRCGSRGCFWVSWVFLGPGEISSRDADMYKVKPPYLRGVVGKNVLPADLTTGRKIPLVFGVGKKDHGPTRQIVPFDLVPLVES